MLDPAHITSRLSGKFAIIIESPKRNILIYMNLHRQETISSNINIMKSELRLLQGLLHIEKSCSVVAKVNNFFPGHRLS